MRMIACASLALTACAAAIAQSTTPPAFEVASIRVHTAPLHVMMGLTISGSRVAMEGYNVSQLITEAYDLKGNWQMEGPRDGSDLYSVFYDIAAKAPGDGVLSRKDFRGMLQTLLADRFKLVAHHETRDVKVYALMAGKNGPKLRKTESTKPCLKRGGVVSGGQSYTFTGCGIESLVETLGNGIVDRPVVDKTGLEGTYDFTFSAMPAFMRRGQSDPDAISPITAVQELGFKLVPQTAPLDVLVVDHAEGKPTEND